MANADTLAAGDGDPHHRSMAQTLVEVPLAVENSFSAKEVLAGGIAGITEHTVMFPFDTIKTRLQQEGSRFRTTRECLKHVLVHEKWSNLYRGCVPVVVSAFPAHGAYFACYESSKRLLHAETSLGYAVAAVSSTAAHDFVSVPFDVVKQRMQVNTLHASSWQCFQRILRQDGVGKLFHSYPTTVAMNVPHIVTQWVVYESCKGYLQRHGLHENEWSPQYLVAGFIAGGCAAMASTPFDVLKTRVQLSDGKKTALQAAGDIMRTHGPRGFFTGAIPRVMSIAPSAAVVLSTYELLKGLFQLEAVRV